MTAMRLIRVATVAIGVTTMLALPSVALAQTHHDVIRGTVTSDSGHALAGADVIVTMAPDRTSQATKTGADGKYEIDFAQGTGDYLVHISALNLETFRKRVTRTGSDSVFVVDAKLAPAKEVQKLAVVTVKGKKAPKPQRNMDDDVGASERTASGVNGSVAPDLAGDINALTGTIPGVAVTPAGVSIGGLDPSQNSTTLNGMAFAGASVPRDARTTVSAAASSYDPGHGWFSGLNQEVTLAPGSVFATQSGHLTFDAPALQFTDPVSARMGQRFTRVDASIGGSGSTAGDTYVYNYGLEGSSRFSDFASLGNASPDLLQHAGVSADSAARLYSILGATGVPIGARGIPSSTLTQSGSFIGRFDHAPYDWNSFTPARTTWGVLGYAKVDRSRAVGMTPTTVETLGGSNSDALGMIQGLFSTYIHGTYLTELNSGLTVSDTKTDPYLSLPGGQVLVGSTFPDGTGGLTTLGFGGNSGLQRDRRLWTWETTDRTQFYVSGQETHRVKVSADSRLDGVSQSGGANTLGSFYYNSLSDLQANAPASFSRTLNNPSTSGGEWNGYVALSDLWRVSQNFQLMYGARLEGNRYTSTPEYNPAIDQAFGVRNDNAPNTVHVSPRIGFTWTSGPPRMSIMMNPIGKFFGSSGNYVRGGFGEFRNMLPPGLLAPASVMTGLANTSRTLTCIGSAVPTPDWSSYESNTALVPDQCAGANPSSVFSDSAPSVQLFDRSYSPPRSWRGNLIYGSSLRGVTYSVEGLASLNVNQPGQIDLNFNNTPRFTVSDEGRPVFVNASSVVPTTGAVSPVEARKTDAFGHVIDNVSGLQSVSKQLTITLTPDNTHFRPVFLTGSYTLGSMRALQSGFDGSTFGSPLDRSWARGNLDIRHQFMLQAGAFTHGFAFTLTGRLQSGLPFTPMVGGDVNGDGLLNDRAFIFDPSKTSDAALASATRSLLSSTSSNVRDCIMSQLGQPAGRNSCEGPWTTTLDARINYGFKIPGSVHRANVALAFVNPLGGLDQLIHGSNNLHGWGTAAIPNPILYNVTGFDPSTNSFKYAVNPRFGDTRPSNTTYRTPFRIAIDIQMDLGPTIPQQQIDKWLRPGRGARGTKLSATDLKRRYARDVPDPYKEILDQTDSLLLTRDQADSLKKIDAAYTQRMDSLWTSLANYLAALPDNFDTKTALKRQEDATDAGWEITRLDLQRTLPTILTPIQLQLLPGMSKTLFTAKEPVHFRIFMVGGP